MTIFRTQHDRRKGSAGGGFGTLPSRDFRVFRVRKVYIGNHSAMGRGGTRASAWCYLSLHTDVVITT